LAPGSYAASVSTFDGTNGSGNELSSAQNVPFVVRLGQQNTVALTLDGIPHSFQFSGGSIAVRENGASGLTIYGTAPQPVVVNALDADGDVIVGAGSPSYAGSVTGGSGWAVATPTPSSPDAIPVNPPTVNNANAELRVTASYADDTCSLTGAVCSGEVSLRSDVQQLFVATSGGSTHSIVTYTQPFSNSSAPVSSVGIYNGSANAIGLDASGNLYFAAGEGAGVLLAPSFSSSLGFSGDGNSASLALDQSGDLFITNLNGDPETGNVTAYVPQSNYSGTPFATISIGVEDPRKVVTDALGNIFVANSNTVTEYAPPFSNVSAPIATISDASANVQDIATDAAGDLFVAYYDGFAGGGAIAEYAAPVGSASQPNAVITSGIFFPEGITLDANGDLFVSNSQGGLINEFTPPLTSSSAPKVAISNDTNSLPLAMAVDGAGNLYVVNCYETCQSESQWNAVAIYAPPYTGRTATITNGIQIPSALVLTP
jgi:hypothetical protein